MGSGRGITGTVAPNPIQVRHPVSCCCCYCCGDGCGFSNVYVATLSISTGWDLFRVFSLCRTAPPHTVLRPTVGVYITLPAAPQHSARGGRRRRTVRSRILKMRRVDKVLPRPRLRPRLSLYNSSTRSKHVPSTCAYSMIYVLRPC